MADAQARWLGRMQELEDQGARERVGYWKTAGGTPRGRVDTRTPPTMHPLRPLLEGGNRHSIGQADAVARTVLNEPALGRARRALKQHA